MSLYSSTHVEAVYHREEEKELQEKKYSLVERMALDDDGPSHLGQGEKPWLDRFLETLEREIQ